MHGLLYITTVVAVLLLMVHWGVGPFAHPSQIHWHQRYQKLPGSYRFLVKSLAILITFAGMSHAAGIWLIPE